jgi:predicted PurR-regulated permease PerM
VVVVLLPICILGVFIFKEAVSIYALFSSSGAGGFSFEKGIEEIEFAVQSIIPGFSLDVGAYIQQFANFIAQNLGSIFAGTASTIFLFFITLMGTFYFFRDGKEFTKFLVQLSPLIDAQDEKILKRLSGAIRSVALGTV